MAAHHGTRARAEKMPSPVFGTGSLYLITHACTDVTSGVVRIVTSNDLPGAQMLRRERDAEDRRVGGGAVPDRAQDPAAPGRPGRPVAVSRRRRAPNRIAGRYTPSSARSHTQNLPPRPTPIVAARNGSGRHRPRPQGEPEQRHHQRRQAAGHERPAARRVRPTSPPAASPADPMRERRSCRGRRCGLACARAPRAARSCSNSMCRASSRCRLPSSAIAHAEERALASRRAIAPRRSRLRPRAAAGARRARATPRSTAPMNAPEAEHRRRSSRTFGRRRAA